MNNASLDRDLTKQAPHSPRDRIGGFVIARRVVDKCRANLAGTLGEYVYDGTLDKKLFSFKGIDGDQFTAAVQAAKNYKAIGVWLQTNGTPKTPAEIKAWSDEMETASPLKNPEKRDRFIENCTRLGLNPETTSTFDWLEADDRASFSHAATPLPPVFPKTLHQLRPNPVTAAGAKSAKRPGTASQSKDTHEDRGTREMKTAHNAQTFPHGR
ncbi:MAG: DUF5069 domain-containing protein [Verrucomicrobiae bacterium]|nr:DUF5069 domain-containing protein [Verrucomicrobiae bacterium]